MGSNSVLIRSCAFAENVCKGSTNCDVHRETKQLENVVPLPPRVAANVRFVYCTNSSSSSSSSSSSNSGSSRNSGASGATSTSTSELGASITEVMSIGGYREVTGIATGCCTFPADYPLSSSNHRSVQSKYEVGFIQYN
jgi:hypothetical protein